MAVKIYIGTEQADYNDDVTVGFSVGDIRDITEGGMQSSYEIELPLTKTNKRLLKYSDELNIFEEVTDEGRILFDDIEVLRGKIIILNGTLKTQTTICIQGSTWLDHFKDLKLRDLDLSTYDHEYNTTNIQNSWSGAGKFYRYPMIHFGQLFSKTSLWYPNDFIPMFRVIDIMTKIFNPWSLSGGWLTDASEEYVLGKEEVLESDFPVNKSFEGRVQSATDNQVTSLPIPDGETVDVTFTEAKLQLNTEFLDEGGYFASDQYTIPVTGTYRFNFTGTIFWTNPGVTINSQAITLKIIRNRSSVLTTITTSTTTSSSGDILNSTYTLDTLWTHFIAGDIVYVTGYFTQSVTNNTGIAQTIVMNFMATTTKFYNTMDDRCRYTGVLKTIEAEKWMPDVTQLDFIKAIKEAYGLRFFPDVLNKTIYVESIDSTFSANEKLLSNIDYADLPEIEYVSSNYAKNNILTLKLDTGDNVVKEYLSHNVAPYTKTVTLSSEYAEVKNETFENSLFASTIKRSFAHFGYYSLYVSSIFGNQPYLTNKGYPEYRASGFATRLLKWEGLTSGLSWNYNGTTLTTYPKASSIDMAAIYSANLIKTYHLIDKGKIIKLYLPTDPLILQQFITVINSVSTENFRPIYKFTIGSETYAGYLNKIEANSIQMSMELILIH